MTDADEDDRRAALVAYLSSGFRGRSALTQPQIVELGLPGLTSQSAVSRSLKHAHVRGYLEDAAPALQVDRLVEHDVFVHVEHLANMVELKQRLLSTAKAEGWPRVPIVQAVPVHLDLDATPERRRRLTRAFFKFAAPIVFGLIRDCELVGISWGATLVNLVFAIDELKPSNPEKMRRIKAVVPLVGEPPMGMTSEFSSTLLAERLLRAFPNDPGDVERLTLRYVHSFISDRLAEHYGKDVGTGQKRALAYYREVSSYGRIFGFEDGRGAAPLIRSIDAVITSLSWDGVPWGIRVLETEQEGEIARAKSSDMLPGDATTLADVEEVAIGDICGVLLGKPGADQDRLRQLQERWTGIKPDQLFELAARSDGARQPGVIVVAFGEAKVQTTLAALRAGYVNHLVIGERLAQGLVNALPEAPRKSNDQDGKKAR